MLKDKEYRRKYREKERKLGRPSVMDQDIPPSPDESPPIEGLDAVDISASMVESATATCPRRAISARLRDVDAEEMLLMSAEDFKGELEFLKERHDQPDFDAILVRSQINDFIRQQEESEVVPEFARNNPDKLDEMAKVSRQQYALEHFMSSLQPQQNRVLNDLFKEHGIVLWPDLETLNMTYSLCWLPDQDDCSTSIAN
ncbi:hypothetical protein ACHAPJ_009451 [Fusarium lateritium]